jgi:hypothetical protein
VTAKEEPTITQATARGKWIPNLVCCMCIDLYCNPVIIVDKLLGIPSALRMALSP